MMKGSRFAFLLLCAAAACKSGGTSPPSTPIDAAPPPPVAAMPVSYSGLVGYWRFDEGQGAVAVDSSPAGNVAELQGGAMLTSGGFPRARFANSGSLVLDGVDGRVALRARGLPAAQAPKTVSLWIDYIAPPAGPARLLSLGDPTRNCGLQLGFHDGRLAASSGGADLVSVNAPRSRWHHLVYTFDGTAHRLIVDGLIAPTADAPVAVCPVTESVLGAAPGGGDAFQGSIDDLRIYDRVLTDAEIAVLVQGEEPAQTPSVDGGLRRPGDAGVGGPLAANLIAYWPLDEGAGTITADLSGSDNLGTFAGAPTWTGGGFPGAKFDNPFSLTLNGNGDQVDLLANRLPAIDGTLSVSLWFNYPAQPMTGNRTMLSLTSSAEACGIQIGTRGANLVVWLWGGSVLVSRPPAPPPGWHHLVYTFDGTSQTMYLDGQSVAMTTSTTQSCTAVEAIIGNYLGGREFFVGQLDDIRVWSGRALTPADVTTLFSGER